MTEVGALKAIEVLLLLAAGVAFVWWQLRDVQRAQEQARADRADPKPLTPEDESQREQLPRP